MLVHKYKYTSTLLQDITLIGKGQFRLGSFCPIRSKNTQVQNTKVQKYQKADIQKTGSSAKGVPVMIRIFSPIHLHKCKNTQMHKYTNAQILEYTNAKSHLSAKVEVLLKRLRSSRLIHSHKYNLPNSLNTTFCSSFNYSVFFFPT